MLGTVFVLTPYVIGVLLEFQFGELAFWIGAAITFLLAPFLAVYLWRTADFEYIRKTNDA